MNKWGIFVDNTNQFAGSLMKILKLFYACNDILAGVSQQTVPSIGYYTITLF